MRSIHDVLKLQALTAKTTLNMEHETVSRRLGIWRVQHFVRQQAEFSLLAGAQGATMVKTL